MKKGYIILLLVIIVLAVVTILLTYDLEPPMPDDIPATYADNWSRIVAEEQARLDAEETYIEQRAKDLEEAQKNMADRDLPPPEWDEWESFNSVFLNHVQSDCEFIEDYIIRATCMSYATHEDLPKLYYALDSMNGVYCQQIEDANYNKFCRRLLAYKAEKQFREEEQGRRAGGMPTLSEEQSENREFYFSALHLNKAKWCDEITDIELKTTCEGLVG